MKNSIVLMVFMMILGGLFSCGEDEVRELEEEELACETLSCEESRRMSTLSTDGFMTAEINGKEWTSCLQWVNQIPDFTNPNEQRLIVFATTPTFNNTSALFNHGCDIIINNYTGVGNYIMTEDSLATVPYATISYGNDCQDLVYSTSNKTSNAGFIEITSTSGGFVKGRFEAELMDNATGEDAGSISGSFDVEVR